MHFLTNIRNRIHYIANLFISLPRIRLDKPDTTSRDQIIEKLRTFKKENAEKYGMAS